MSRKVPKLRFKEFSGEWEEKHLKEVVSFLNNKIPLNEVSLSNYISTENILPDFGGIVESSKLPDIANVTSFKENDILISNIRPYLKKIWLANINGGASNDIIIIRTKKDYNYKLLFYIVQNDKFINYVMQGAKGVKMPRGDISLIKKYPLFIPKDPKEQQKIANTLSSLDNLIETQEKKVEALKKHKKGLMQQLFPQEGEKTPKLRFKEFSGEWEEINLKSISNITTGISNREDSTDGQGKYTFFDRSEDIRTSHKYLFDDEAIIVAGEGQKFAPKYFKGKFDLHQRTYAILELQIIGKFLYYYVDKNKSYFLQNAVGSTVKSLRLPMFEKMPILLPTLPEQQKIANTLSSLDNLIEAEEKKVEALKKHKKGLMQQMFVSEEK